MREFAIFAHGEHFEPDKFLAEYSLPYTTMWRRGEPKAFSCIGTPHTTSGIAYEFPEAQGATYLEQPRIARAFIAAHRGALASLGADPDVPYFTLGLHYPLTLDESLVGFALVAGTVDLMRDLVSIGCELTTYVTVERPDAEQA